VTMRGLAAGAEGSPVHSVLAAKGAHRVGVCIPARDEAGTIGGVLEVVGRLRQVGLVDEVIVVDDASADATARKARSAGARVVPNPNGPGKGQALRCAVAATDASLLVFLDADVTNFNARYVTDLLAPLLHDPSVQLVKATYRRPLDGRVGEGGRVTELLARPLLRRWFPDLAAAVAQPLAGECAVRRDALDEVALADGYGIEIALLIDVFYRYGLKAIVEADLGVRVHRNRPLHELRPHTDDVLAAVLARVPAVCH
jgi:glucosyl-3-phosphoglycerate synthase